MSLHPTTTSDEAHTLVEAVREVVSNARRWEQDYVYSAQTNEFQHINAPAAGVDVRQWFDLRIETPVSRR